MRFSKLFNVYRKDNNEEKYVSIENVYTVLTKEGETFNKANVKRSLNNFQGGPRNVLGKDSASVFSVLKYLFVNSSHKSCSTIIENIIKELTEKDELPTITSSLELYKLIAKARLHDNDLFQRVGYDEDNISTLIQEHRHNFTELEWKNICWFENDFSKDCKDADLGYEEIIRLKYEKFQSILNITDCSKKWLDVSKEQIRRKTLRYKAAEKESQVQISAGLVHIAPVLDDYIFTLLDRILPNSVRQVVCFNSTCHNIKDSCLWVALVLNNTLSIDNNDLCTRIFFGCKREHCVYIEKVFVLSQAGGVRDFIDKDGTVYRFLLRDAIESGTLRDCITVWQAGSYIDGTIDHHDAGGKCEPCFSSILCKPLSKENLQIETEWYREIPIYTQILLERFISRKSVKTHSNPEIFSKKKLEKLFMLYDTLLNVLNKKFIGVFQKSNSQKLLIEYKSIGSVFDITSSAGATVSLCKAESQLKSSACKDMLYYNTYLKEHKLLYSSVTGDVKEFVTLRGCHLILMLDNLVRLKYVADPNPGEHRSKQICTLPITLQGLPLDSRITEEWHLPDCDGSHNCICKSPLQLQPHDVEHTLLQMTEIEEQTHQQFFDLMTFGYSQLWKELPDDLLEYLENAEDPNLMIEETDTVVNTDFPTVQEDESDGSDDNELDESLEEVLGSVEVDETVEYTQHTLSDSDQDIEEEQVQFLELETSLQNMSITDKDEEKGPCMRELLQSFGFKKNIVEPLLTRHPEPAVGRDDDLDKVQEILDDVLVKMGYVSDPKKCTNRILCGPDNKIGKLLLQLMARNKKYHSFLPEFPVLHLRKSKINILFGSYKYAGLIEILKYLKDEEQDDWAKLISISHIDMATKFVKRIALALHLAFLITFIKQLDQQDMHEIISDLEKGVGVEVSQKWSYRFGRYLSEGSLKSPTFELHVDMMRHCDEVVAIALAERLGGHKGYTLLLSAVKSSLLFSFLNNASSYAPFCVKLLYHHYSAGFFHQCMKHELFSTHFKGSLKNFGLDTKREMDHLEALKGFRAGSTVTSATCRMSLIDSLNETEGKHTTHLKSDDDDMLGWTLTDKDLAYIYKATALILRQHALTLESSDILYNVYSKTPVVLPKSILDSCSRDAGKYLLMKFLHKEKLYCLEKDNFIQDNTLQGPVELVNRVKRSKGTTIRRLVPSHIRSVQTELQSKEEIRKRKVMKESKTIDHFSSSNNTCQAILKADSSKPKVLKAIGMKKALLNVIQSCAGSQEIHNYIDLNTKGISDFILSSMKLCIIEFAGVKFKTTNIRNGIEYLNMVTKMIDDIVNKSQTISQIVICEEKYSFTPDTLKAETRKQRETKCSDVSHLKTPDSVISDVNFDKDLATKTAMGKKCISTYLAKNLEKIELQKSVNMIVDSEAVPGKICNCTHSCDCIDHCIPVACTRQPNSNKCQVRHMTEIKQRKGEAEMAIVDWLISLQHTLEEGDAVVSLISSGDIDAVYIHLFALCRFRVKAGFDHYKNPVYVVLQKPGGMNDVYNITSILTLLEKHYCDDMIGCKLAIILAIGGNDFLPKFYSHSHDEFCKAVLGTNEFRNGLVKFEHDVCYLNMDMYVELLKFIYTPKRYQHSNLSFDDVRALSICKTEDTNTKSGFRTADPRKWLPPKSCIERLSSLVQVQIDYLLTAGIHTAKPLNFLCACLRRNADAESEYDFGPDAYFSNIADLPNARKGPQKRQLQDTPQRGQRRKKQLTSTPRKM